MSRRRAEYAEKRAGVKPGLKKQKKLISRKGAKYARKAKEKIFEVCVKTKTQLSLQTACLQFFLCDLCVFARKHHFFILKKNFNSISAHSAPLREIRLNSF